MLWRRNNFCPQLMTTELFWGRSAIQAVLFSYFYWHGGGRRLCVEGKGFSAWAGSASGGDTAATQAPAPLPPSQADIQPWPKELIKLHFLQPIHGKKKKLKVNRLAKSKLNPHHLHIVSPKPPALMLHNFPAERAKANREGGAFRALPTSVA